MTVSHKAIFSTHVLLLCTLHIKCMYLLLCNHIVVTYYQLLHLLERSKQMNEWISFCILIVTKSRLQKCLYFSKDQNELQLVTITGFNH